MIFSATALLLGNSTFKSKACRAEFISATLIGRILRGNASSKQHKKIPQNALKTKKAFQAKLKRFF